MDMIYSNRTVCALVDEPVRKIKCFKAENTSEIWTVPTTNLYNFKDVESFAYDWVAENWYIVDPIREVIQVCLQSMTLCVPVHEGNLTKPRGIAVDPVHGFMFFTKWGNSASFIEKSFLNGSHR